MNKRTKQDPERVA